MWKKHADRGQGRQGEEEEEEDAPTPGRRLRRTSDLPDQKRLYSFFVKVKRWRYVSKNDWRVIGPEEDSIPYEEAEVRRVSVCASLPLLVTFVART